MFRLLKSFTFMIALGTTCVAQMAGSAQTSTSGSTATAGQSASMNSEASVQAELTKSIDAKKAKPGDKVEAKTVQDATVNGAALPKGTKLVGHVTQAKPWAKGRGDSALAVAFDNAILKNGQTIPFHATVLAAAAPAVSSPMPDSGMEASGSAAPMGRSPSSGGPLSGVSNTAGETVGSAGRTATGITRDAGNVVGSAANSNVGTDASGNVSAATEGGRGIPGVTLRAAAANQTDSSVFTSDSKNVKLDSGSMLVLRIATQ